MIEEKILPASIINQYNLGAEITALVNSSYRPLSNSGISFFYKDILDNEVYVDGLRILDRNRDFFLAIGTNDGNNNIVYDNYTIGVRINPREFTKIPVLENWGTFLYVMTESPSTFNKENVENIDIYVNNEDQDSIQLQEPPVITDLSNTVWCLKEDLIYSIEGNFNINFYAGGKEYRGIDVHNKIRYYDGKTYTTYISSTSSRGMRKIIIKDGIDAKNTDLIGWITRNAAQCEVTIEIEGETSYDNTSLNLSLNQLKSLLTTSKKYEEQKPLHVFKTFRWGDGERAWKFHGTITAHWIEDEYYDFDIDFIANEIEFKKIRLYPYNSARDKIRKIGYIDENNEETIVYTRTSSITQWWQERYRSIIITSQTYSDTFALWMLNNATEKATGSSRIAREVANAAKRELRFDPFATLIKILVLQEDVESQNN